MIKKYLFIVTFFVGIGVGLLATNMFSNKLINASSEICSGKNEQLIVSNPIIIDRVFYGDSIKLKDYFNVEFKFISGAKTLIEDVRKFHKVPSYIKEDKYDEGLCAGYIRIISQNLRGEMSPYYIGMKHPEKQVPSKAWELPYSYFYRGGKVIFDMAEDVDIRKNLKNYWNFVKLTDLKKFFAFAFSEENLLGDIGWLYKDSNHFDDIGVYGNYNSHISKNFGISDFEYTIIELGSGNLKTLYNTLGCAISIGNQVDGLLENYQITLNGNRIVFKDEKFYELLEGNELGQEIQFKYLDQIIIKDITLVHFHVGPKVDSLFQFVCQGNFFPINVININPKFIEKW